ncbi:MAG: alpha/beta fold hydrolase [Chloroflexota bacterium]|nr:alpha/beta fold hydrolase [Chloroflexota bacterium]
MYASAATGHSVDVDGAAVYFARAGYGEPVVLLHGLGEAGLIWHPNVGPLAERFSVYVPDLWGHGRSADLGRYDFLTGARMVTGFLDALGIDSAHLVGNSLGGYAAAGVAIHHPERVRSLVLEDAGGLGRRLPFFLRLMTLPVAGEFMAAPRRASIRRLMGIVLHDPSLISPGFLDALVAERSRPGNAEAMLRILRCGANILGMKRGADISSKLGAIRAPTLIAWGRQDPIFPVRIAERAAGLIPNAVLDIYDDCGHWPHYEHADRFNAAAAALVERAEAARAQATAG